MSLISNYITSIQREFDTQQSTEHSFRPALKTLLESLDPSILALNESQRIVGVGMPDFTIKHSKDTTINIGWIEAKDLWVDLDETKNADQLGRYLSAFDNFIYTNNLTFQFYRQGKKVTTISLGTATKQAITRTGSDSDFLHLEQYLKDFLKYEGQTITSPEKLARAMAQKAQLIKHAIETIFVQQDQQGELEGQYQTFKDQLVHDLTHSQFADMYAQTIAYGLFAARLYDPTLPNFSREEAAKLVPKTNPLIRRLFKEILNSDTFDDRLAHIIDDLVNIFLHCNVAEILSNYGRATKMQDPIIHFYETFLSEYDSSMRKKRGVYYTPEPVVQFIVRGVDHLLKKEFGLSMGLADTSKIEANFEVQGKKVKQQVHRVQVLDPATGTGTFLHETIKFIRDTYFAGQQGMREGYVSRDLLPRIWGFEILMASYTMAHLKIGMMLKDSQERVNIYLTNSLDEPHDHLGTLFSAQLARESEQASKVKKEQPIMIVMGNPPYSGISSNMGEWIMKLIEEYKYVDGVHFGERKHRLGDDYVKFIRYAEYFIEKNQEGIVAYICPHGFLDNPTFRGMRRHLLKTFDVVYTVDLHGNAKKKEVGPDGSKDENVFDIQQGVAITFFVKKSGKKKSGELATVYHYDLYGKREDKYVWLHKNTIENTERKKVPYTSPNYFFVPKDDTGRSEYEEFVRLDELFPNNKTGIVTMGDGFAIADTKQELIDRIQDFLQMPYSKEQLTEKYGLGKNYAEWIVQNKISGKIVFDETKLTQIAYRPFDMKRTYYDNNILRRRRDETMKHFVNHDNLGIVVGRQGQVVGSMERNLVSCCSDLIDFNYFYRGGEQCFPLYLYSDDGTQRKSNININLLKSHLEKLGMSWIDDGNGDHKTTLGPEDLFDYIYAVLHSPTYRETYREFLKIDFPRIPFVTDKEIFWQLVDLGHELRLRHLMEHPESGKLITQYPIGGDNKVSKLKYENNKVRINETQYIDNVSQIVREFYIGGYQPAQKWLKDRKEMTLGYEDIIHYQKIILALTRTAEVMEKLRGVEIG